MKQHLFFNTVLAILSLAIVPLKGQAQDETYIETSKIVGTKVQTAQGEEVGEIKDVVLDGTNGCVAYTVVATSGAGGGKSVAVPWAVYSVSPGARVYTVEVDREKIYSAPVFEASRIREYSSSQWIDQVYSHYGVSAGARVGAGARQGVSGGARAGARGAQASSGATGSPSGGRTSPARTPATTASPRATRSPAETASPAQTRSPEARTSPSPRREAGREASPSRRETPGATPSSRQRHETTPGETRGRSASETTESPSTSERESSRQQREPQEQRSSEPGTTPGPKE